MTLYWWSHWFWITCLSVHLFPKGITHVQTYPSKIQKGHAQRLHTIGYDADGRRQTTKLYRTLASRIWSTVTQSYSTIETTATSMVTHSYTGGSQQTSAADMESLLSNFTDEGGEVGGDEIEKIIEDRYYDNKAIHKLTKLHNQFEFKRSANYAVVQKEGPTVSPAVNLDSYRNLSRRTSIKPSNQNSRSEFSTITTVLTMTTISASKPANRTGQTVATTPSTPKINMAWLSDLLHKAPFTFEKTNKEDELRRADGEHRSRKSKVLFTEYKHRNRYINFSSDTNSLLTRSTLATTSVSGYNPERGNISSEALAIQRSYNLDAGAILTICFTVFGICCTVVTFGILLFRRRFLNKPQALNEPDSSVYIDDSMMRDNSDEMYSLDNDSFLNSLEAMTIQNYWTDTVKHTKL